MGRDRSSMRGQKPQGLPRPSHQYPGGRVCSHPDCETRLSTYNRRDRCWAHAEMRVPRLRGRNPAAGST
jgi:hypothetical protein